MREALGACGLVCLAVPAAAIGQAVRLGEVAGGSPRYLSIANSASLRPANITLECWVRALGPGFDEPGVGSLLIGRPAQGVGGTDLVSWGLYYSGVTGVVSFEMAGSVFGTNGQTLTSVGTFPVGTSAHVAVTYDGSTIKLYLNGVLDNQAAATYASINYTRPDDVLIGAANYAGPFERRFNGMVDEARIWSVARTAAQIADARDARLCTGTAGLAGNWSFTGGSLLDTSGNGNNATAVAAVSFGTEISTLADAGTIVTQPADAQACNGHATFGVGVAGPGLCTFQWQIKTGAATWVALSAAPVSLPCGGSAAASAPAAAQTDVSVTACPGVSAYQVRCVVSGGCGGATSNEATYSICYANCDCSTVTPRLNTGDFTCFLQKYAAQEPYANCDNSTTEPTLNTGDFTCFLQRYAAGCS
jgi:hypothetical protein